MAGLFRNSKCLVKAEVGVLSGSVWQPILAAVPQGLGAAEL